MHAERRTRLTPEERETQLVAPGVSRDQIPDLVPRKRLDDTLTRIVQFVRDHGATLFSLVRGAATGDPAVREVFDRAERLA